jgi:hypothetical protein
LRLSVIIARRSQAILTRNINPMPTYKFYYASFEDDHNEPWGLTVRLPTGVIEVFRYTSEEQRDWAIARLQEISEPV